LIKVLLITYTPDPETLISSAAKLCYSPSSIEKIREKCTPESSVVFVKMLSKLGHQSPLEHISFTFGIEGVSRIFLAQLTRHRIASYSVQSQRYVKETGFNFVVPPQIAANEEAKKEFENLVGNAKLSYEKITKILVKSKKKELNNEKNDEKFAIEDARYVLPGAVETKIVCTFNARSLLNFLKLRCCSRAQWEIRETAEQMLRLVIKVAPDVFISAGPPCISGICPEGKMTCGKHKEIVKKFESFH
jgi:thymidylate synthase (FAD)